MSCHRKLLPGLMARLFLPGLGLCTLVLAAPVAAQSRNPLVFEPYTFRTYDGRAIPAELGTLEMPEHRGTPGTRTVTIAFVRLRSTSSAPGAPIVWLAGGPGIPGIAMAKVPVYFALFEKLREVGDVILLDQRGVGLSQPSLDCTSPPPPKDVFESAAKWLAAWDRMVISCDQRLRMQGIDVKAYTLAAGADDIDDLRRALGAARVSLIGHSFGTMLAQEFVRRHRTEVDRVVLANVKGEDHLIARPSEWDVLLEKLSLQAARDSAAPAEARDLLALAKRVAGKLDRAPIQLRVTHPQSADTATLTVGGFGVRWLFRNYAADARTYAWYSTFLLDIDRGRHEKLAADLASHYFSFGRSQMATVTDCSIGWTKERFATAEHERDTFYEIVNNQWRTDICARLGYEGRALIRPPLISAVPALFISGTLDANTPPHHAEEVRWGFVNSTHLIVENAGHETIPSAEVQAVIVDFFRGKDVSTRHVALPPPRFTRSPHH